MGKMFIISQKSFGSIIFFKSKNIHIVSVKSYKLVKISNKNSLFGIKCKQFKPIVVIFILFELCIMNKYKSNSYLFKISLLFLKILFLLSLPIAFMVNLANGLLSAVKSLTVQILICFLPCLRYHDTSVLCQQLILHFWSQFVTQGILYRMSTEVTTFYLMF